MKTIVIIFFSLLSFQLQGQDILTDIKSSFSNDKMSTDTIGGITFVTVLQKPNKIQLFKLTSDNTLERIESIELVIDLYEKHSLVLEYPHVLISNANQIIKYDFLSGVMQVKEFAHSERVDLRETSSDGKSMIVNIYNLEDLSYRYYIFEFESFSFSNLEIIAFDYRVVGDMVLYKKYEGQDNYYSYDTTTKVSTFIYGTKADYQEPVIVGNAIFYISGSTIMKWLPSGVKAFMQIEGIKSTSRFATKKWNNLFEIEVIDSGKDHKVYYFDPDSERMVDTITINNTGVVFFEGSFKRVGHKSFVYFDNNRVVHFVKDRDYPDDFVTWGVSLFDKKQLAVLDSNFVLFGTFNAYMLYDFSKNKFIESFKRDNQQTFRGLTKSTNSPIMILSENDYFPLLIIDLANAKNIYLHDLYPSIDIGLKRNTVWHQLEDYLLLIDNYTDIYKVDYNGGTQKINKYNNTVFGSKAISYDNHVLYFFEKKDNLIEVYAFDGVETILINSINQLTEINSMFASGDYLFFLSPNVDYYCLKGSKELLPLDIAVKESGRLLLYKDKVFITGNDEIATLNKSGKLKRFPGFITFNVYNDTLYAFKEQIYHYDINTETFVSTGINIPTNLQSVVSYEAGLLLNFYNPNWQSLLNWHDNQLDTIVFKTSDWFWYQVFQDKVLIIPNDSPICRMYHKDGSIDFSFDKEGLDFLSLNVEYGDSLLMLGNRAKSILLRGYNGFNSVDTILIDENIDRINSESKVINYYQKYVAAGQNFYVLDTFSDSFVKVDNVNFADDGREDDNRSFIRNDYLYYLGQATAKGKQVLRYLLYDNTLNINYSEENFEILIYPNPASDRLFIELPSKQEYTILIYNIEGRLIRVRCTNGFNSSYCLDISDLVPGQYFIKLVNKNNAGNLKTIQFLKT